MKDLKNADYFKISFIGNPTERWLELFEESCDDYNNGGYKQDPAWAVWAFETPFPMGKENEEYILRYNEDGIDVSFDMGGEYWKFLHRAMDDIVSRTNIRSGYRN